MSTPTVRDEAISIAKIIREWTAEHPEATPKEISAFMDGFKAAQLYVHARTTEVLEKHL